MTPYPDPAGLTPDDRLRELARVLATGLLRLALAAAVPATSGLAEREPGHYWVMPIPAAAVPATSGLAEPSEFRANDLAVSPAKSVTVHAG